MATDELLWKKVDEMKTKRPKTKQKTATRPKPARKATKKSDPAYASNPDNSGHNAGNLDAAPSAPADAKATGKEAGLPVRTPSTGHAYARTPASAARLLGQVPPRPVNRQPERYAFNFWADQITRLKKLKQVLNVSKDADDRSETTLSDLVREAIDDYLDRQTGRNDRTQRES